MLELRDAVDDETIGGLFLDDEYLYVTEGVAAELVDSLRDGGLADPDIYDALDGWSNGYLYIEETGDHTHEAVESPALARWLEHGTHDQRSHGRRYRIPGDRRSGILPSISDLRALAESKGVTVPKRARKADIAKMLDDAGPREPNADDLFPGRPRQSEKLDAKLDAAFGPAEKPARKREPKAPKTKAVWQPAGELPVTGTIVRQNSTSVYVQSDSPGASGRVERIAKRGGDWKHSDDVRFMDDDEFAAAHDEGLIDDPARMPEHSSTADAVRQATQLSDTTGRPSAGVRVDAAKADIRSAVERLRTRQDGWVGIADLRDELGGRYSREEFDDAVRDIARNDPGMQVIPVANRKALKQRDHDAHVALGGDELNAVRFLSPTAAGERATAPDVKPEAPAKPTAAQARLGRLQQRYETALAKLNRERANSREQRLNLQSEAEVSAAHKVRLLEQQLRDARAKL